MLLVATFAAVLLLAVASVSANHRTAAAAAAAGTRMSDPLDDFPTAFEGSSVLAAGSGRSGAGYGRSGSGSSGAFGENRASSGSGSSMNIAGVSSASSSNKKNQNNDRNNDDVEMIAGYVSGQYQCTYDGVNGTLYAGGNALYFVGSSFFMFGDDKRVTIDWDDVRKVERGGAGGAGDQQQSGSNSQNAIEIVMKGDHGGGEGGIVHRFSGIHHPDRVWVLLVSLHNDSLLGGQNYTYQQRRHSVVATPPSLKRRNSDPLLTSKIHHALDVGTLLEEEEEEEEQGSGSGASEHGETDGRSKQDNQQQQQAAADASTAGLDINSVESLAGKITLQPISCTHNNIRGKLFAGKGAVYFYGRKFWIWDRSEVLLRWDTVKQIQIVDAKKRVVRKAAGGGDGNDNGDPPPSSVSIVTCSVGIRLLTTDGREFRFLEMDNADRVWSSLVAMQNQKLTAAAAPGAAAAVARGGAAAAPPGASGIRNQPRHRASSIARSNSDPNIASILDQYEETESSLAGDNVLGFGRGGAARVSAAPSSSPSPASADKEGDDAADWAKLMDGSSDPENTYSNVVVEKQVLHCSLDKFFDLFVRDDAECGIAKFLESRNDSNLQASPWEKEGQHMNRVVRYTHPVNVPMAPPKADARKEQKYRRYKGHGIAVWTKTFVDDLPMTDCFYVTDMVRVVPNDEVPGTVTVYMAFEVKFVKSTMFKGIINKTTSSEFKSFFLDLAKYMSDALGETPVHVVVDEEEEDRAKETAAAAIPARPTFSLLRSLRENLGVPLLATVVVMQMWILLEIRGMKSSIRELQQQQSTGSASHSLPAETFSNQCPFD